MACDDIVKALRCISTEGNVAPDCKGCPFYAKEQLDPEWAAKVGTDELYGCDCNAVGFAAADLIENQQNHIRALLQANDALRPAWTPVTEGLPEKGAKLLLYVPKTEKSRQFGIFTGELKSVKADDGSGNFWSMPTPSSDWTLWGWSYFEKPNVTHWMPLPEPPKEANRND